MKILYGIQGTGNGHITRARVLAPELFRAGFEVDFLCSGRAPSQYFDMDPFPGYQTRAGLTFVTHRGRLSYGKTALRNNLLRFAADVRALDLSGYDLVITDFEPITAWAAKLKGVRSLGISHQYSFKYQGVPQVNYSTMSRAVMRWFAPASIEVGVHWHHFDQPIFPPLIEPPQHEPTDEGRFVLVYLPFEDPHEVTRWLSQYPQQQFHFYCGHHQIERLGNVTLLPFSRSGFQQDLAACSGVIGNAGFGLASEAIQLGKKLLVKPVKGQGEQLSNGVALERLKLGKQFDRFDDVLESWLQLPGIPAKTYPHLASFLVNWIASDFECLQSDVAREVWAAYA